MSDDNQTDMERKVTKRKVSVDVLENKDLYYRNHGVDPSDPGMQRIEINYVDMEDIESTDTVDPDLVYLGWEALSHASPREL